MKYEPKGTRRAVMFAAGRYSREFVRELDAYGDARELAGHVEVCGKKFMGGPRCGVPNSGGIDWYCDDARRLIDGND